jgi:hypothetical protein
MRDGYIIITEIENDLEDKKKKIKIKEWKIHTISNQI